MAELTRRTMVGRALALPLAAVPASVALRLDVEGDDRLLAMWERRKALLRQFYAGLIEDDDPRSDELDTLSDAIRAARPTTLAGIAAQLAAALVGICELGAVERAMIDGRDPRPHMDLDEAIVWRSIRTLETMGGHRG